MSTEANKRPKGVTHGTWNKNPGNIKGYRDNGGKTDFTKWLDKQGIPYSKGTAAADGGYFIKFENDEDGLKAADNFWSVVKTWSPYKGKTVQEALGVYAADGYDKSFLDSLAEKGIDLNAKLDSLPADSLATISHHQMQTEDPNQYKNLQSSGLISKDGKSQYEGAPKSFTKKEKSELSRISEMDNIVALHREQSNAYTDLTDGQKLEAETKLTNILKGINVDMKSGEFDKRWIAEYEEKGDVVPLFKDASRAFKVSQVIAKEMGWNEADLNDPKVLGLLRAKSDYMYNLMRQKDFQESIGGDQFIDSTLEDVLEDSMFTSGNFAKYSGIPELGYATQKIEKKVRGAGTEPFMGAKEGDVGFWDEPGKDGKLNLDGYEEWRENYAKKYVPELIYNQTSNESVTSIIDDAQEELKKQETTSRVFTPSEADGSVEYEKYLQEQADKQLEDDVMYDSEGNVYDANNLPAFLDNSNLLTTDEYQSFTNWQQENPEGTFEDYNKTSTIEENKEGQNEGEGEDDNTKKYFDLRGESGIGQESFLDKIGGLSSLIGLATGAAGIGSALKDVDIPKDPKLGPAFQQRLEESKRMAQQGLTPSELAKAHNELDSSYATGIENIVRGSAGNRAQFMAGLGGLDVARQSALMDIAVADAQMQRQNQEKYDGMMLMNEQYEAARQAKYQDAKFKQDTARQAAGAALVGNSIAMISDAVGSRHINRYNKIKTQKLLMDMGYVTDKNGKSGQDKVGTDENGNDVQTSFTLPNNLLDSDDVAVNTTVNNQNTNSLFVPQTQQPNQTPVSSLYSNDDNSYIGGLRSSGLIGNTDTQVNLGSNLYDIFNK